MSEIQISVESVEPKKAKKSKSYDLDFKKRSVDRAKELDHITKASQELGLSVSTLAKWVKVFDAKGLEGLASKSSRPHHQPKKTSQWLIDKILSFKKEKPEAGAALLSNV